MHSHLAVESAPALRGAEDGNSLKGVAQPWLRSLDGLNTHDDGIALAVAGGVTSSLILPGSANAIGKVRPLSNVCNNLKWHSRRTSICNKIKAHERTLSNINASRATVWLERIRNRL